MSYTKHTWVTGETITAENLNNIEDGVDDVSRQLSDLEENQIPELTNAIGELEEHSTNSILPQFEDHFPIKGKYIKNNKGELADAAGWGTTDYIPIEAGWRYNLTSYNPSGYFIAFYDENKVIKRYFSGFTNTGFNVPYGSNWRYVRLSIGQNYWDTFDILKGVNLKAYYGEEAYKSAGQIFEVGADKQFQTLKSACAFAANGVNNTVIVYPGVYDLAQEFATEIASGGTNGIALKNGIKIVFLGGSFVTCLLDTSVASHANFQPFYAYHDTSAFNSDFTLDGLHIRASNCRNCVHDELVQDERPYKHVYHNCHMEYNNTFAEPANSQCIAGGLGINGYIDIDGGYYAGSQHTSTPTPISWHNTANANGASKIFLKNAYIANGGKIRFGWYGTSTTITPIYISGCSFGYPIEIRAETASSTVENIELIEWNNIVRT